MAGFVYEVAVKGIHLGVPIANIYHLWDGDEDALLEDILDLFEDDLLTDMIAVISDNLTFNEIVVTPLDYLNPLSPVSRAITKTGASAGDPLQTGGHVWAKFVSGDAGEKSGGKMYAGCVETQTTDGLLDAAALIAWQVIMNAFLTDLGVAGLALAIYRPTLSIPGDPEISIVPEIIVRGLSSNNRRFQGWMA